MFIGLLLVSHYIHGTLSQPRTMDSKPIVPQRFSSVSYLTLDSYLSSIVPICPYSSPPPSLTCKVLHPGRSRCPSLVHVYTPDTTYARLKLVSYQYTHSIRVLSYKIHKEYLSAPIRINGSFLKYTWETCRNRSNFYDEPRESTLRTFSERSRKTKRTTKLTPFWPSVQTDILESEQGCWVGSVGGS